MWTTASSLFRPLKRRQINKMSYGIGTPVEVITFVYLGRWVEPGERGVVIGRHVSPAGQEVYDVELNDGQDYTFAPGDIEELEYA